MGHIPRRHPRRDATADTSCATASSAMTILMCICASHVPFGRFASFSAAREETMQTCQTCGLANYSPPIEATRRGKSLHRLVKSSRGDSFVTRYHGVRVLWGIQIEGTSSGKSQVRTGAKKQDAAGKFRNRLPPEWDQTPLQQG